VKLPKPNVQLLKVKSSISTVIASKLDYLEKGIHLDLHTGLVGSADDLWLLNYYFIVERLIVNSMISDSEDFDLALLERVKKTNFGMYEELSKRYEKVLSDYREKEYAKECKKMFA
jgi:hypothetical protein